jgi:hypothetical protein
MSLPSAATRILAWRWALEGQHIKGILRLHFLLAFAVVSGMWMTVWLGSHRNSGGKERDSGWQIAVEFRLMRFGCRDSSSRRISQWCERRALNLTPLA